MSEHSPCQRQRLDATKARMGEHFTANQVLGRLKTIGCTAVEITQKCNLDCTLCYLSEHSQQVKDVPIEEVFRRLDMVVAEYGTGVPVQITGGDPTLRKHHELVRIVEYASNLGLHPALFTNGIAASRELLTRLAKVGLSEVAFHVDTTQRRQGYPTEASLNAVRAEYIERARGLGLMIVFNTTVHTDNFLEVPDLARFFVENADAIGLVSFQLQAETGRGEWGSRGFQVTRASVAEQIAQGVGPLPWDRIKVGHPECHSYVPTLVAGNRVLPVLENQAFFESFMGDFADMNWDRHQGVLRLAASGAWAILKAPGSWPRLARQAVRYLKLFGSPVLKGQRLHKLSFFVQNFMDASALDADRVHACSFMVMTNEGPVSMCEHNARRDEFILQPLEVAKEDGSIVHYQPLKPGQRPTSSPLESQPERIPLVSLQ